MGVWRCGSGVDRSIDRLRQTNGRDGSGCRRPAPYVRTLAPTTAAATTAPAFSSSAAASPFARGRGRAAHGLLGLRLECSSSSHGKGASEEAVSVTRPLLQQQARSLLGSVSTPPPSNRSMPMNWEWMDQTISWGAWGGVAGFCFAVRGRREVLKPHQRGGLHSKKPTAHSTPERLDLPACGALVPQPQLHTTAQPHTPDRPRNSTKCQSLIQT